jgi:hypothetical protein
MSNARTYSDLAYYFRDDLVNGQVSSNEAGLFVAGHCAWCGEAFDGKLHATRVLHVGGRTLVVVCSDTCRAEYREYFKSKPMGVLR